MDEIEKRLRSGVKYFISQYSPVSHPEESVRFQSSSHAFREICFVIAGSSRYMVNNNVYEIVPGSCVFIDSWIPHAFGYLPEDRNLIHLWIHFSSLNAPLSATLSEIRAGGIIQPESSVSMSQAYADLFCQRIQQLEKSGLEKNENTIRTFLLDPINGMLGEVAFQRVHQEVRQKPADHIASVIHSVKIHILRCNARGCSYQMLERLSGFSKSYLAHCFRYHTGMTIGDFIDKVRIDYTVRAQKRGMKQKEIAAELGFSSPVNYWSWLQKHKNQLY